MQPRQLGKYVVADPGICHGKLTFKGTRILVKTVLAQVASGEEWDTIIKDWDGKIGEEAISEAVLIASEALATWNPQPSPNRNLSRVESSR